MVPVVPSFNVVFSAVKLDITPFDPGVELQRFVLDVNFSLLAFSEHQEYSIESFKNPSRDGFMIRETRLFWCRVHGDRGPRSPVLFHMLSLIVPLLYMGTLRRQDAGKPVWTRSL